MARKTNGSRPARNVAVSTGAGARQFREAASNYANRTTRSKEAARAALLRIGIITEAGKLAAPYKPA